MGERCRFAHTQDELAPKHKVNASKSRRSTLQASSTAEGAGVRQTQHRGEPDGNATDHQEYVPAPVSIAPLASATLQNDEGEVTPRISAGDSRIRFYTNNAWPATPDALEGDLPTPDPVRTAWLLPTAQEIKSALSEVADAQGETGDSTLPARAG